MAFGKVFESMFTGSMVGTSPLMFSVWTYCIANSKPPGYVEINPNIVATILGATTDEVQDVIDALCAPDPLSRTPDEEGRKLIQEGHFLYRMPTWAKYNAIRNEEKRREQNREAQARRRERCADVMLTDADVMLTDADSQQSQPTEMEIVEVAPLRSAPIDSLRSSHSTEGVEVATPGKAGKPKKAHTYSEGFELWWMTYPRKSGKGAAFNAWKKVATSGATRASIMEATAKFAGAVVNKSFVPLPATWLNQRRFDDDPQDAAACSTGGGQTKGASHAVPQIRHNSDLDVGDDRCECLSCKAARRDRRAS